ncbi:rab3 GTPase-activating protein catalytic subunit [Culicoides brevitarsis]|uniref:rab3 GTPase-activating protein catalytic subunit n=1 Tax=Culicoides brevitarsis TaxID=469753 RepID=UPI00307C5459
MCTQEIDDSDFFHQDFSTASEWENFSAQLEQVLHEWKIPSSKLEKDLETNQLLLCNWKILKDNITFSNTDFEILHYKANIGQSNNDLSKHINGTLICQCFLDLMSSKNDFLPGDVKKNPEPLHPIARWYGLRNFVILRPVKSIQNESQIRILLSSLHIALADSACEVPIFLQILRKEQNVFLGVCEHGSTRTSFDIIHSSTIPQTCRYLSGIIDMFKGKVLYDYLQPVTVGVRLSYSLRKFSSNSDIEDKRFCLNEQPGNEPEDEITVSPKVILCGTSVDPISEIVLNCTWMNVAENCVIDSQSYSDFDPLLAPQWSLNINYDYSPVCYTTECISEYLNLASSRVSITEYYHNLIDEPAISTSGLNPLDRITESRVLKFSSVLPIRGIVSAERMSVSKEEVKRLEGPINENNIMKMLYYLFPDAHLEETANTYTFPDSEIFDPLKIKSAPKDSLVHRLSVLLAFVNANFGGKTAIAQLWAEFVQEMRYRVENSIRIPGVQPGFPDFRTCLFHQKLQMLNICIERRLIREGRLPFTMTTSSLDSKDTQNDSEEEFFDCHEADDEFKTDNKHSAWNQPTGRLSKLGNMLLVNSNEPLYIPITQEPVPKTEDQTEDDAEILLKLGPGSELRAQMMSASLLSDMESFKAANPAGRLEDFIRWYSPRDWIEDEHSDELEQDTFGRKGTLSSRMLIPGNMWQATWEQAKPVPARRQRRLFDDTKESEKVLHFFEMMSIGSLVQLTTAPLFHAVIENFECEAGELVDIIPDWNTMHKKIIQNCCKFSRDEMNYFKESCTGKWTLLLNEILNIEYLISQAKSLRMKLVPNISQLQNEHKAVLTSLLKHDETELVHGAKNDISVNILKLFTEAKKLQSEQNIEVKTSNEKSSDLPCPFEKQFTLRACGKLVQRGMGGPQFLRAIVKNDDFRICGAFSQDTTLL